MSKVPARTRPGENISTSSVHDGERDRALGSKNGAMPAAAPKLCGKAFSRPFPASDAPSWCIWFQFGTGIVLFRDDAHFPGMRSAFA
jgi:hypothetical protein